MSQQLTLTGLSLHEQATFDNYFYGENTQIVDYLKSFIDVHNEQFIYLWGEVGTGKSHLLQACCHQMSQQGKMAMYLSLADYAMLSPECFEDLEQFQLVCLDAIDAIAAQSTWEEALFGLYNRLRDSNVLLLVAGNALPKDLGIKLADLVSRLNWGPAFMLHPLSDDDKCKALQFRAKGRGLKLTTEVASFLLHRCERNMKALFEVFEQLDQAALANKHRLTIPFVKSVLGL